MNNLEFAHSMTPRPILEIGELLGLHHDELIPYGRDKAKISLLALDRLDQLSDRSLCAGHRDESDTTG